MGAIERSFGSSTTATTNEGAGNVDPAFSPERTAHRDLKPANILIADGNSAASQVVKLADFGVSVLAREDQAPAGGDRKISPLVALLTGEEDASESSRGARSAASPVDDLPTCDDFGNPPTSAEAAEPSEPTRPSESTEPRRGDDLTEVGMIVGTPMYMAPEISFGSRHAQPPSDVFAFGVIAYELLTKELPFKRPPVGTMLRHETLGIPLGLRTRGGLAPALLTLFERALSMEPELRPTAAELAAALLRDPPRPADT